MRNTKSAFTLVELIVVITILAILGTIAFISLQGYSADARNSKRTSDIGNIQSAISLKMVEGVPLMSFVADSANELTSIDLGWATGYTGDYKAGKPSYTVLNVAAKDFKDPQGDNEYRIGATDVQNGVFQIAASMETDGTDTAQVNGTFVARTILWTTSSGSHDGVTVTLDDEFANTFKAGDTLNEGGIVKKVSRDGVTLTMTTTPTADSYTLAVDESLGLIAPLKDENGDPVALGTVAIENLDTDALPY